MNKKKRLGLKIGIGVLVLLLAALAFAGNYLVDFAIVRKEEAKDVAPESTVTAENQAVIEANTEKIKEQTAQWLTNVRQEEAQLESEDGLQLKGDVFWTDPDRHKWLIAVPGDTDDALRGGASPAGEGDCGGLRLDLCVGYLLRRAELSVPSAGFSHPVCGGRHRLAAGRV